MAECAVRARVPARVASYVRPRDPRRDIVICRLQRATARAAQHAGRRRAVRRYLGGTRGTAVALRVARRFFGTRGTLRVRVPTSIAIDDSPISCLCHSCSVLHIPSSAPARHEATRHGTPSPTARRVSLSLVRVYVGTYGRSSEDDTSRAVHAGSRCL